MFGSGVCRVGRCALFGMRILLLNVDCLPTGLNNAQKKCVSTAHGSRNAVAVRGWFLDHDGGRHGVHSTPCWVLGCVCPPMYALKPSVSSSVVSDYSWFIPSLPFFMVSSVVACQLGAL